MSIPKIKIAVIGSGPGGSFCALALNKNKFDVTVIDKKQFPRDKTCGDAISIEAVKAIREFDDSIYTGLLEKNIAFEVSKISILSREGPVTTLLFDELRGNQSLPFISKRYDFDNLLHSRISGQDGINFVNKQVDQVSKTQNGVVVKYKDETEEPFDMVVFASGSVSLPNKIISDKIETKLFYGVRQYVRSTVFDQDTMYFVLNQNKLPAYCWVFPVSPGVFNAGIYFDINSSASPVKITNILEFFKTVESLKEFAMNAEELSKPSAFHIPYNINVSGNLAGENYIVTGSAGGFTDPLTGEGIGHAIKSGLTAARVLNKIKTGHKLEAELQEEYVKDIRKNIMNKSRQSRMIQRVFGGEASTRLLFFLIKRMQLFKLVFRNTPKIRRVLDGTFSR